MEGLGLGSLNMCLENIFKSEKLQSSSLLVLKAVGAVLQRFLYDSGIIELIQILLLHINVMLHFFFSIIYLFQKRLTWCNSEYHDRKELWAVQKNSNIIKLLRYET